MPVSMVFYSLCHDGVFCYQKEDDKGLLSNSLFETEVSLWKT